MHPSAAVADGFADLGGSATTENTARTPSIAEVYEAHVDFVWRSARRLGVPDHMLDDAVQDVFLAVHRRLSDFEGRASIRTWLFAIAIRVVRDYRRRARRKPWTPLFGEDPPDAGARGPEALAMQSQAAELLRSLLDQLDPDKREVLVLTELEHMTAPEISAALDVNVNTVYARLRAARREINAALVRHRARQGRLGGTGELP
jgi:RNA polymerase sigma-70 factor (ECF subfamily)